MQSRIVPSQYYKGRDYSKYLEHSRFLADINNERKEKNRTYAQHLASLDSLVMVMFQNDVSTGVHLDSYSFRRRLSYLGKRPYSKRRTWTLA